MYCIVIGDVLGLGCAQVLYALPRRQLYTEEVVGLDVLDLVMQTVMVFQNGDADVEKLNALKQLCRELAPLDGSTVAHKPHPLIVVEGLDGSGIL